MPTEIQKVMRSNPKLEIFWGTYKIYVGDFAKEKYHKL
jgi:hypothetical protein